MKTKTSDWNGDEWLMRCAWCGHKVPEGHEVFGLTMRFRSRQARPEWAGTVQPLRLVVSGRTVAMMVCSDDSPAKRQGTDAIFQVCSEDCGKALTSALQDEIDLGDILSDSESANRPSGSK
jgi:hypothetical protein